MSLGTLLGIYPLGYLISSIYTELDFFNHLDMARIRIIIPQPGPTTQEQLLELIQTHPKGLTLKEMQQSLNRSISMLQCCLKILQAQHQITSKCEGMQRIYTSSK